MTKLLLSSFMIFLSSLGIAQAQDHNLDMIKGSWAAMEIFKQNPNETTPHDRIEYTFFNIGEDQNILAITANDKVYNFVNDLQTGKVIDMSDGNFILEFPFHGETVEANCQFTAPQQNIARVKRYTYQICENGTLRKYAADGSQLDGTFIKKASGSSSQQLKDRLICDVMVHWGNKQMVFEPLTATIFEDYVHYVTSDKRLAYNPSLDD